MPLATIAQAAGMSRSTLVRRLNGSRQALDEAVRATGIDPGGRPVRVRAIEAGARLVSDRGLATVTLEAVAEAADCSVHSLYAIFGTRDELFAAIYERYSPLRDVLRLSADPSARLEHTVAELLPDDGGHSHPRAARGCRDAVGLARQPARHRSPDLCPVLPTGAGLAGRLAGGAGAGRPDPRHSGPAADAAANGAAAGTRADAARDRPAKRIWTTPARCSPSTSCVPSPQRRINLKVEGG